VFTKKYTQKINPQRLTRYMSVRAALISLIFAVALPAHAVIEEIVVTARKTEESLSDTPVAVSVLDSEFFADTGINTIADLVRFVPGLDLTPINTTRASGPKVRGISTFSFSDGFESSVATVIDGVVMGREAQGFFDLYGIESVEILKGPQGTLFGKNASAGVINVRTLAPEFETGGGFDLMYGSYNEVLARGTVTGGIVPDKLAYRLSGTLNQHDGKLDNVLPGEDDINDKDTWSLRGKLLFTPSDVFSATLIADYVTEDNRCCLPTYRVIGPPTAAVLFAQNSPVLQLADALAAEQGLSCDRLTEGDATARHDKGFVEAAAHHPGGAYAVGEAGHVDLIHHLFQARIATGTDVAEGVGDGAFEADFARCHRLGAELLFQADDAVGVSGAVVAMAGQCEEPQAGGAVSGMDRISEVIGQLNTIATQVDASAAEQAAATGEIAHSAQQTATGTRQVSDHISNMATETSSMRKMAVNLQDVSKGLHGATTQLRERISDTIDGLRREDGQIRRAG